MSYLQETINSFLPTKRKITPSGWISFNAPCCIHNGHSVDTRNRGGIIFNTDGLSYHCFNCGYKCSWQLGRNLSIKCKKFLEWLNIPNDIINKISLEIIKENQNNDTNTRLVSLPKFQKTHLPDLSSLVDSTSPSKILDYIAQRNLELNEYPLYYTNSIHYKDRLIIPFYFKKEIVGYTARSIKNKTPKYLTNSQPGYIFNIDNQLDNDKKFIILCEGPIDAIHTQGISVLGSEINEQQTLLINSLQKEVIVVPDRDTAGKKLMDKSLDEGWSVSMPAWGTNINDIGDAVDKYGRLLTLYSIIHAKEINSLKIKLGAKHWFG